MYYIAKVDQDKCTTYKCNQCTIFCPEANTLMFDKENNMAWVDVDRCKGCALCVYVCTEVVKRGCIEMVKP